MTLGTAKTWQQAAVFNYEECARSPANSIASGSERNKLKAGRIRLAVPRRGHVLSTVVETYGKPIREAVGILSGSFTSKRCSEVHSALLSPRVERPEPDFARSDEELAAWAVVSMWVVGVAVKAVPIAGSMSEAERWFSGDASLTALLSGDARTRAETVLRREADATAYFELLPYVLDPHGPGSRLSVRRDPDQRIRHVRASGQRVSSILPRTWPNTWLEHV